MVCLLYVLLRYPFVCLCFVSCCFTIAKLVLIIFKCRWYPSVQLSLANRVLDNLEFGN